MRRRVTPVLHSRWSRSCQRIDDQSLTGFCEDSCPAPSASRRPARPAQRKRHPARPYAPQRPHCASRPALQSSCVAPLARASSERHAADPAASGPPQHTTPYTPSSSRSRLNPHSDPEPVGPATWGEPEARIRKGGPRTDRPGRHLSPSPIHITRFECRLAEVADRSKNPVFTPTWRSEPHPLRGCPLRRRPELPHSQGSRARVLRCIRGSPLRSRVRPGGR